MAEIVRMPKLSDTMTDGVVAKWHKKVGDVVKSGELLADIETDKATMEFESFQDGVLLYIGVQETKSAPVNAILAILGAKDDDVQALLANEATPIAVAKPIATPVIQAPAPVIVAPVIETKVAHTTTTTNNDVRLKASPLAKAIAADKGININNVKGSGDDGRVVKRDLDNYNPAASGTHTVYATVGEESFTDVPVSQMRKTIARRLTESKQGAPHFYLTVELDMENAMAARTAMNAISEVKISFNDLVIKACAAALRKHPKVNTSWRNEFVRHNNHIHIGMAVAVEDGLLVPVIRFADNKSLAQIATETKDLGKRAKDKKLQPADWEGNTFTVSNLGMLGIDEFTSIINTPESCILSVGAIRQVPVVKNNQVVPGNVMKVTLACDHRTVDGATGAQFLQTLKAMIENPVTMLV
ncbi:MAG: pyruvate dehydrogenase complex dihydrolipoamide acetyltransferase [Bacteroidia bacterium]|nr:pyruvate dehydrogenase complex dihydrolipoamide acetyltransferase [Bacteroidia bacterium]